MLKRIWGWGRRRFEKQDGETPKRRGRLFQRLRILMVRFWQKASDILPKWLASYLVQGFLIFLGAPWWVWPVIAIAAWWLLSGVK